MDMNISSNLLYNKYSSVKQFNLVQQADTKGKCMSLMCSVRVTFVDSKSLTNGSMNAAIMVVSWEIQTICKLIENGQLMTNYKEEKFNKVLNLTERLFLT
ncbi:hypothetical protein ACKWTF_007737 [Chironomus riparius]